MVEEQKPKGLRPVKRLGVVEQETGEPRREPKGPVPLPTLRTIRLPTGLPVLPLQRVSEGKVGSLPLVLWFLLLL